MALKLICENHKKIFIGDDIEIAITGIFEDSVRMNITAPKDVKILRENYRARKDAEKLARTETNIDQEDVIKHLRDLAGMIKNDDLYLTDENIIRLVRTAPGFVNLSDEYIIAMMQAIVSGPAH